MKYYIIPHKITLQTKHLLNVVDRPNDPVFKHNFLRSFTIFEDSLTNVDFRENICLWNFREKCYNKYQALNGKDQREVENAK